MIVAITSIPEAVSFRFEFVGLGAWLSLDGLLAVKWSQSFAFLLVARRLFQIEAADLVEIRWNGPVHNKTVFVVVVAAQRVVEPVLVIQLSCRSEVDQSKVDDFHFLFLMLETKFEALL